MPSFKSQLVKKIVVILIIFLKERSARILAFYIVYKWSIDLLAVRVLFVIFRKELKVKRLKLIPSQREF